MVKTPSLPRLFPEESDCSNKVLGIAWNSNSDELVFNLKDVIDEALKNVIVTKRVVLKVVSSIYDPLGILSPAVVQLKKLFQEVCSLKCDWDIPLSKEFINKWKKVLLSLIKVEVITVSRHYLLSYDLRDIVKHLI